MKTKLNVLMVLALLAMLLAVPAAQVQAEPAAPSMHVGYILLTWKAGSGGSYTVTGRVLILDENYRPLNRAVVSGEWTLPDGTLVQQAMTDRIGVATFRNARDGAGEYKLCVTGVSKAGYTWAPGPNDCRTVTVP